MTNGWKLVLTLGVIAEIVLFSGSFMLLHAQAIPTPRPAPQSQTLVGQEIAAGLQAMSDASNNTNALVLIVIAVSILVVAVGLGLIVVVTRLLDALRRQDETTAQREQDERADRRRREEAEAKRTEAFTASVNTFALVTARVDTIDKAIGDLKAAKTESSRRTEERDKKYFERISTAENRVVESMEHFGVRMSSEVRLALIDGQKQAANLIIEALPDIIAKVNAPPLVVVTDDPAKVKTGQLPHLPEETDGNQADCE